MNPSYPGPSGHGPPLGGNKNNTTNNGPSLPPPPPQHSFQPSSLAQLPHPGHSGLHPLHGGGSNLLHSGGIPPPLPPPPLPTSTLGQGTTGSSRSPHHSLSNSILHPPRGPVGNTNSTTNAPTLMGKPLMNGALGSGGNGTSNPNPSTSSLMNHTVRLPSTQSGGGGGSMKSSPSIPSFSGGLRPPPISPPRSIPHGLQPPPPPSSSVTSSNQSSTQPPPPSSSSSSSSSVPTSQTHYETESEGIYFTTPTMNMGSTPPPRHRELRVEDALLYLDQVKQQFGDQPDIYNQFLDVMKDFKAQSIDTPGVILRVSSLFRGYPNLILGFNTFLPPGYRIRPDTSIEVMYQPTSGRGPSPMSGTSGTSGNTGPNGGNNGGYGPVPSVHRPPPVSIPPPLSPPKQSSSSNRPLTQSSSKSGPTHPSASKKKNYVPPPSSGVGSHPIATAMRGNTSNPVEFDHAIHYVTTIKQRFSEEPETYKEFLGILHTYQQEQRSIRQVLDQVSYLFRDHPDLLREFTFFLPDAVQEQAKERLNRAAEKAQQRKDALHRSSKANRRPSSSDDWRRASGNASGISGTSPSLCGNPSGIKGREGLDIEGSSRNKSKKGGDASGKQRVSPHDLSKERQKALFNHKRNAVASSTAGKRRHGVSSYHDSKERRSFLALSDVLIDSNEWGIFEKIKKILPSRENWREFLKCLELYAQEVVGRKEMMSLIRNLCGRHESIINEFDQLLVSHGEEEEDANEIWPFIPLAETDLSQCRRATPSYRALPSNYPIPPCSYRSTLEKQLCNDSWVSVPTGSEDFSFKNMRKNQYEEALFKCEDERFEIDMVIDANAQTISILTPLLQEISILKEGGIEEKLFSYRLDKNTLRITHLNAISRIYGESGNQLLELLRTYPAGTIPIIYQRLLQKDKEWRQARQDLNKQWKEVNEKNYHKSLDHSSFYFKQKDKKQTSCKQLIQEIKQVKELIYHPSAIQIHKDVYHLLSYAVEKHCNEREKIIKVWHFFLFSFLYLPQEWFMQQPIKQTTLTLETSKEMLRPGTRVRTDFGDGIVQSFDSIRGICMVQLSIGDGYLQPHAIMIEERMMNFPSTIEVLDDVKDSKELKSIIFGNTQMYVLLRLYQLLHARLEKAFELCEKAKRNRHRRTVNPAARALDHARSISSSSSSSSSGVTTGDYQMFLSKLYALIDGSLDPVKYEDGCRTLMGSTSYFLFTMDKLVQQVVKQMQQVATDEICQELIALYTKEMEKKKDETEEEDYLIKARGILEGEHAFRLEYRPGIVRKTPLAPPRTTSSSPIGGDFKIWAPSPRVRQQEPSKWLVEPELKMEYLGSTEEDDDKDENASTNDKKKKNDKLGLDSPLATPPDTPSFGSPYHDGSVDHDIKMKQEEEEDEEDEAKDEEGMMEQSGGEEDVESVVDGPSDDEGADRKRSHSNDVDDRSTKRMRRDQGTEDDNDTADEDPTMGEGEGLMEEDEEEDDDGGQSTPESLSSPSRTQEDGDRANV